MDEIKTVEDYIKLAEAIKQQIKELEKQSSLAYDVVANLPVPANLRLAVESDIADTRVIWYPNSKRARKWFIVRGGSPSDYLLLNGGAFVEVKSDPLISELAAALGVTVKELELYAAESVGSENNEEPK